MNSSTIRRGRKAQPRSAQVLQFPPSAIFRVPPMPQVDEIPESQRQALAKTQELIRPVLQLALKLSWHVQELELHVMKMEGAN